MLLKYKAVTARRNYLVHLSQYTIYRKELKISEENKPKKKPQEVSNDDQNGTILIGDMKM